MRGDPCACGRIAGFPARDYRGRDLCSRCELIVMASHGRTGLQRILLGSITQNVLAGSHAPGLVLPLQP